MVLSRPIWGDHVGLARLLVQQQTEHPVDAVGILPLAEDRVGQVVSAGKKRVLHEHVVGEQRKREDVGGISRHIAVAVIGHDDADIPGAQVVALFVDGDLHVARKYINALHPHVDMLNVG